MNYIQHDTNTVDQIPKEEEYVPAPVKSGSLVLLHGQTYHKSSKNVSSKSRFIYTFHIIEGEHPYPKDNWLQASPELPFMNLYEVWRNK